MMRIQAGEITLNSSTLDSSTSSLTDAFCGFNTSVALTPLDESGNKEAKDSLLLETGYIILVVGVCIAVGVLLLVAIAKRQLVGAALARAGQRRAGQPRGECLHAVGRSGKQIDASCLSNHLLHVIQAAR